MMKRTNLVARRVVSNFLREPAERKTFAQVMEHCETANVDMASQHSSDFLLLQSKLLKYRVKRLAEECKYIAAHPFGSFPPLKQLVVHCMALPAVFVLALWVGRYSRKPLAQPPSQETQPSAAAATTEAVVAEETAEEGENAIA